MKHRTSAALADRVFGVADLQVYLEDLLSGLGPIDAEAVSQTIVDELTERRAQSSLGIIGATSLLFASSLVFLALVDAVNSIWAVPVRTGFGNTVRRRLISFVMVLAAGGVLIAGVAVSTVMGLAERIIPGGVGLLDALSPFLSGLASWVALVGAITLLFRYVGPVHISWPIAGLAAAMTSAMLYLGTVAIGWYFSNYGASSVTGAFGALLGALTFVYYETQIVLVGAQLVKVLTYRGGWRPDEAEENEAITATIRRSG